MNLIIEDSVLDSLFGEKIIFLLLFETQLILKASIHIEDSKNRG